MQHIFISISAINLKPHHEYYVTKRAMSIRYVNKCGIIKERFLGFYDVSENRTAEALYTSVTSILCKYQNYRTKLVGQCYDEAAVMAGSLNSLQTTKNQK